VALLSVLIERTRDERGPDRSHWAGRPSNAGADAPSAPARLRSQKAFRLAKGLDRHQTADTFHHAATLLGCCYTASWARFRRSILLK